MVDPVLSVWSPISKLTSMHPKSDRNKLYYIPFDASRRALQDGIFGLSILNWSPYPSWSFCVKLHPKSILEERKLLQWQIE